MVLPAKAYSAQLPEAGGAGMCVGRRARPGSSAEGHACSYWSHWVFITGGWGGDEPSSFFSVTVNCQAGQPHTRPLLVQLCRPSLALHPFCLAEGSRALPAHSHPGACPSRSRDLEWETFLSSAFLPRSACTQHKAPL